MSKIYHYTKLNTVIEHILPSMTLRTNFLNNMNDPKENHQWAFGGVNIDFEGMYPETYSDKTHIRHMYKLGEEIKSQVQALCFVNNENTDGFDNQMMWAHYSDNHTGICLEIDLDKFIEENSEVDFFKFENIEYGFSEEVSLYWRRELSKEENIKNVINRYFKSLFLAKSNYWEKEYEKRLLILEKDHTFLSIIESLTGVYLGIQTNYNYIPSIKELINNNKTKVYNVYFESNRLKRMQIKLP